ncbi:MAG: DUF3221 domain-containing protein [Tissierellia bacterium]|nr:DUF3221 domain-containing protein [Tissierellia bacterium]
MKRLLILGLALVFAMVLVGCSGEAADTIGIRGEIKEIYTSEDGLTITGILVEGEVQDDTMYDSGSITINEDTEIYMGEEEVTPEELSVGLMVEIIFDGPVAESYPVQGTAKKIIIIE